MMKYIIIAVLSILSAQAQNNVIKYSAIQTEEAYFQKNLPLDQQQNSKQVESLISKLKIELIFNDSLSVFKLEDEVQLSTYELKMAATKAGVRIPRFMNLKENKSYYQNQGNPYKKEKEFLIYQNLDFDWKITNEVKQIDDFKVIKAICKSNKNERMVDIVAWFAPEIPYRYGPYGIGNLPGVILEMQIDNILYVAKEILLKSSEKVIKIPAEGKLIFAKDYYEESKKRFEEFSKTIKD